jgi:hypothetical protein
VERTISRAFFAQLCAIILLALTSGCVSEQQKINAVRDVNAVFRTEYERVLAEDGTHTYDVPRDQAFQALRVALGRLGMRLADQSPDLGYLSVYAPAPAPLTRDEWLHAAQADLPKFRAILEEHLGFAAHFVSFEPQGIDSVINATTISVRGGTAISLTMRMREVAPPKSGYPRREYAPPTAVRMGLHKIWGMLERELPPGSRPRS